MCRLFKHLEVDHRKWRAELTPDESHSVLKVLAQELSQPMLPKPNNSKLEYCFNEFLKQALPQPIHSGIIANEHFKCQFCNSFSPELKIIQNLAVGSLLQEDIQEALTTECKSSRNCHKTRLPK